MKLAKLPAGAARFLTPLVLTFLMTFFVAGISTWIAIGEPSALLLRSWGKSWMISWIIAFPAMVALMPVTRRMVALMVKSP